MQDILHFTRYFFKHLYNRKFVIGKHHELIADALSDVFSGKTKRLIINIAPRYGKTELAVKNFIAMGLAMNPASKYIHLSYSDALARDNSQSIQNIIQHESFQRLFPEVKMETRNAKRWKTTAGGGVYAVSSGGQVTGFGAGLVDDEDAMLAKELSELEDNDSSLWGGAIVIDDPIKPDDARSAIARDKVNNKFETTIRNRVNSRNTPIVIIMQRLDANDLCGYLMNAEPDEWKVLSIPCIEIDEDGKERPLWEFKMSLEELYKIKATNSFVFETQYMQNPVPLEGLMYENGFKTYSVLPSSPKWKRKNYTDTADTGADFLCSIDYVETDEGNYIIDIVYTQKPMEFTEPMVADMMTRDNIDEANIESNNGGRGFARNVERLLRQNGNNTTRIKWFAQTQNKNARIFAASASVQNIVFFPENWEQRWSQFANAMKGYMKTGRNDHDDAPDCITGTIEKRPSFKANRNVSKYF